MKSYIEVQYRDIARMFVKALPLNPKRYPGDLETITTKVNEYTNAIKSLPLSQRLALKIAYVFSAKVPREDREDMFQELALGVLKMETSEERFAYAIARQDWRNWWARYRTRQNYFGGSLNETVTDSENDEREQIQLIVGEVEFDRKVEAEVDAQAIFNKLPDNVKPIINKRLIGAPLTANERQTLSRYVRKHGASLLIGA